MKLLIAFVAVLFVTQAHASDLIDCTATAVYGGMLEESFSVDEYPEVTVNAFEASLGASAFSVSDGDMIELTETENYLSATVILASGEERYEISVDKKSKLGTVTYHTTNEWESEGVADLICK